ncbi:MAG: hypothetical protein LBG06_04170 [Deltaproteobacteria bacterium]|jgi:hypothetical protein|nr:hypothetical protein [Deltaproteobacteria bacterium]
MPGQFPSKGVTGHPGGTSGKAVLLDFALLAAASVAVTACYALYLARVGELLHSDMATEILTGREMYRQGTVFLSDFYHSTEIFLFRSSLFVALWLLATDSLLDAYRLSIATDIAFQILCFLYMMRRLGSPPGARALGLLAFFGSRPYSSAFANGLAGASYGTMCATPFLMIGYYAASRRGTRGRADAAAGVAIPPLAFLFGLSSQRFLAAAFLPLLVAHVWERLKEPSPRDWTGDRVLRELLLWTALCAAGWVITSRVVIPRGFGPTQYQTLVTNGIVILATESLPQLLREFLRHTPLEWVSGVFAGLSLRGATGISCLLFFIACAWGASRRPGAGSVGRFPESLPPREASLGTVYLFFLVSIGAAALSMSLFLNPFFVRLRYLVFLPALVAIAAALAYGGLTRDRPFLGRAFLAFSCGFFLANSLVNALELPAHAAANPSRVAARHAGEIEDSLARHGIRRAYALMWHSAVETVLTDGRIEVWGVTGAMKPFAYLGHYSAWAAERADEPTAFLKIEQPEPPDLAPFGHFTVTDRSLFDGAAEREIIPDAEYDIEILFFDRNPFVFPPGHDPAAEYRPPSLAGG